MISIDQINAKFKELGISYMKVAAHQKVNEKPHPFCVTSKHVKRYHIDVHAGPCGMRTHATDPNKWDNKRNTKEGITEFCGLSYEEHTYEVILFMELLEDIDAKLLNDALEKGGELDKFFQEHFIKGFGFIPTEPQYNLIAE